MTGPDEILARVRAAFPALDRTMGGRPVAYLDGPGGTQVPRVVADAVTDYLLHHNANTHWNYPTSEETDRLLDEARRAFADFFRSDPAEVVFGLNMTSLAFHVGRALGWRWGAGDEIVVTELDHHGNIGPWQAIARERGVTLRWVPLDPETGTIDLDDVAAAIGPGTRLVAAGWASNALGTVNDVAAICRLAREAGALSFVDAVHSAPHILPDVRALDCDLLACSAYKFYGPHLGVLFGKRALLDQLAVPKVEPAPDLVPEKLELGTQCHEAIVGGAAAVDFLASIAGARGSRRARLEASYRWLHERGERLARELWDAAGAVPGTRRFGPPPGSPRTPTVSFVVEGRDSAEVGRALADQGVFVSHGDFYAKTVVERLGVEGLVRAGAACFTDREGLELGAALAAIDGSSERVTPH